MKLILTLLIILSSQYYLIEIKGMSSVHSRFVDCIGSNHYNPNAIFSYIIENVSKDKYYLKLEPLSIHVCVRKISIKIVFDNSDQVGDEYFSINEVEDPDFGKSSPLNNPILVKLHREQTQIIYPIAAATGHCLKHSESWYSVCKLKKPVIVQETTLQILQKISNGNNVNWIDLTRGQVLRLGTSYQRAYDELPSIVLSYSSSLNEPCENQSCPVNPKNNWLLFPTSETEEIMSECIFVSKEDIALNGKHYDEFSIIFDELLHMGDRCQQTTRTCLTKQPLYLENYGNGKIKKYYLENLSIKPIVPLPSASKVAEGDFIALEYTSPFTSYIDIDIRADSNALIRKGLDLQIQSISTDSTAPWQILIENIVVNTGLVEGIFQPNLINCTSALPSNIFIKGPKAKISPMHRHVFLITIEGNIVNNSMSCVVEILNEEQVSVADKRALFKKDSRCICSLQYECSCFDFNSIVKSVLAEYKSLRSIFSLDYFKIEPLNVFLTTCTILLLLGKLKILFGICSTTIRNFGANYLRLCFKCCINPFMSSSNDSVTFQRAGTDILLNMFFFVLYPMAIIWNGINALWQIVFRNNYWNSIKSKTNSDQQPLVGHERKSTKDNSNINFTIKNEGRYLLEEEDTQYVQNALNTLKSEKSSYSQRSNSL